MARMHSRKKGKSKSKKPSSKEIPANVKLKPKEIEKLIVDLKKKGLSMSRIGLKLRDEHDVPDVKLITGKSVKKILEENNLVNEIPEDLLNLMTKAVRLRRHLEQNNHDVHNKRSIQLIESKIKRLVKYYLRTSKLPSGWKYSYDRAKLLVE